MNRTVSNLFKACIVVLTVSLVSFFNLQAQNSNSENKDYLSKKEQRELALSSDKELLMEMAENRDLILEATAVYGRHGYNAFDIGPNNFVLIDSTQFMIQTSSTIGPGQNGLGGVTLRGKINSYEIRPGKGKRPVTIIAQVSTMGAGFATVTIRLFDSKNSQATFSNNSTTITLSGPVKTKENSNVYKGMSIY